MSTEHIWEIKARNTPLLKKRCSHCDSTKFYCSEKFRLNAQKKNIDIWLIYRCTKCSNTYNMTIFSRVRTESIDTELYKKFMENDPETAWEYAFSQEIRRKNNAEADLESVEYDILHDTTTLEDLIKGNCETAVFTIRYPFEFNLRFSSVIRIGLALSSSRLNRLIETETISVNGKSLLKKHKTKNGDIIRINLEKLKSIYRSTTPL
ncbi:DUF1062 domain-containing protein [Chryseobacterium indologenes]|uniref:Uncharacterized protein n=1 Tax=Chryseobacterium indologenes TaxID=253 RepID=A0A0N0ZVP7_CHRID|nr:DUF1062 domain-containing protein [Chryseobacterium indologenes]KPE49137.1 hypothetical protein AOB46_21545 [Chryseobacterium indologenes]